MITNAHQQEEPSYPLAEPDTPVTTQEVLSDLVTATKDLAIASYFWGKAFFQAQFTKHWFGLNVINDALL